MPTVGNVIIDCIMNIAVIFAGGSGTRMNTKSHPKQFLDLNGKPILVTIKYTDTTPLERDFGFKPSTPVREGLRKSAEWFKAYNESKQL